MNSRDHHLFSPGPKRILSLDGGGVRGIVALAFLERVEALLAARSGRGAAFRLCDHFDLVGGTSTGAIIASALALGYRVAELIELYLRLSHRAFRGARWHGGLFVPKFPSKHLLAEIRRQIGDLTLGSDRIRTGLAIVAKRADTGSPWVFHNNPRSRYFEAPDDDPRAVPNRDLELAEIIRASTAAPTYYEPEAITIARGVEGVFIDGGVSPYNNPALLLLMMATVESYGYGWPTGAGKLSMVSVGTGLQYRSRSADGFARLPSGMQAVAALQSTVNDANWQAQAMLQWLGDCPAPWRIDSEIGTAGGAPPHGRALLGYQRYDLILDRAWIEGELGLRVDDAALDRLTALDRPEHADELLDLARQAAERQVRGEHLEALAGGA